MSNNHATAHFRDSKNIGSRSWYLVARASRPWPFVLSPEFLLLMRCLIYLLPASFILCTTFVRADDPPKLEIQTESIKTLYSVPVKFDMVKVPAGKFNYSPDGKAPPREVEIKSFW